MGQVSCGVAFSCQIDEANAIGEQAASQPLDVYLPGVAMKKITILAWSEASGRSALLSRR
jgi:hypothetical protein